MRSLTWLFVLFALTALVLSPVVSADEGDDVDVSDESGAGSAAPEATETEEVEFASEEAEQQQWQITSSPDISTRVYFPDYPDKRFPQGEDVTVLVGVSNTGSRDYNISWVLGHLHSPFDFTYIIQNLSVSQVFDVVEAGKEITISYAFRPDPALEPLDFHLSAYFYYNSTDRDEIFRTAFFNGTIELVEKKAEFSTSTFFSYVLVLAAIGLVAYFVIQQQNAKSPRVRRGEAGGAPKAAWSTSVYTPADKPRVAGGRRTGGTGSKKNKE